MANLAQTFLKLSRDDFAVLKGIEAGMRTHEWVPLADVARNSGLAPDKAEYRLRISIESQGGREGDHSLPRLPDGLRSL